MKLYDFCLWPIVDITHWAGSSHKLTYGSKVKLVLVGVGIWFRSRRRKR